MIGIVSNAAMMLDSISDTGRLVIGEGVETTLGDRQLGLKPGLGLGQRVRVTLRRRCQRDSGRQS
jgi:hypothetical protein